MYKRDLLYKKAKKSKLDADWIIARRIRNLCNSSIRLAKNNNTKSLLERYEEHPYRFWQVIESTWSSSTSNSSAHKLDWSECQSTNPTGIDTQLFQWLSMQCWDQTGFTVWECSSVPKHIPSFTFRPIQPWETRDIIKSTKLTKSLEIQKNIIIIKSTKLTKSSAIKGLTSRILKDSFEVLQDQLCHLFNVSLKTCKFSTLWKRANVVLIHKGQDKLNVNNYRPISLLHLPGKLLESLDHKRLLGYLEDHSMGLSP